VWPHQPFRRRTRTLWEKLSRSMGPALWLQSVGQERSCQESTATVLCWPLLPRIYASAPPPPPYICSQLPVSPVFLSSSDFCRLPLYSPSHVVARNIQWQPSPCHVLMVSSQPHAHEHAVGHFFHTLLIWWPHRQDIVSEYCRFGACTGALQGAKSKNPFCVLIVLYIAQRVYCSPRQRPSCTVA